MSLLEVHSRVAGPALSTIHYIGNQPFKMVPGRDTKAGPGRKATPKARDTLITVDDVGTSPAREASPSLHDHADIAVLNNIASTPPKRETSHSLYDQADFAAESWLMASAATHHMTLWASDFMTYLPYKDSTDTVALADGETYLKILGIGSVRRHTTIPNGYTSIRMDNVLHVDGIKKRSLLTQRDFHVSFTETGLFVRWVCGANYGTGTCTPRTPIPSDSMRSGLSPLRSGMSAWAIWTGTQSTKSAVKTPRWLQSNSTTSNLVLSVGVVSLVYGNVAPSNRRVNPGQRAPSRSSTPASMVPWKPLR